jgi:hypothetical protein
MFEEMSPIHPELHRSPPGIQFMQGLRETWYRFSSFPCITWNVKNILPDEAHLQRYGFWMRPFFAWFRNPEKKGR